jgi:CRISPR type IV-associated protein Csf3
VLAPVAAEVVRRRRKKPHPEAMALAKVQTTGGPWKALDIPVAAWSSPVLTWYAIGDRERLESLLPETHALGRGRSGGLGNVDAWSVERDESAATRWRERPLPVADSAVVEAGRMARVVGVRHPFWHPRVRTLAACPVVA